MKLSHSFFELPRSTILFYFLSYKSTIIYIQVLFERKYQLLEACYIQPSNSCSILADNVKRKKQNYQSYKVSAFLTNLQIEYFEKILVLVLLASIDQRG